MQRLFKNFVRCTTGLYTRSDLNDLLLCLKSTDWHNLADDNTITEAEGELSEAQATHKLIIDNKEIKTTNSIKLLGINIDDQLKFNEHNMNILCSKAVMQLNALSRLQKYMEKVEKEAIINSFFFSGFNYELLRGNSILYNYIKNSTLYDGNIIVIHIICICICKQRRGGGWN